MASGDLPDWTIGQNIIVATETNETIGPAGVLGVDTSNAVGLTIHIETSTTDAPLTVLISHLTPGGGGTFYNQQWLTCIEIPGGSGVIDFETPSYGNLLRVQSDVAFDLDVSVLASGRAIPAPRYLDSTLPGQVYEDSEAYVNGTPVLLTSDLNKVTYPSNGSAGINAIANTNGSLQVQVVTSPSSVLTYEIAVLVADTRFIATMALPQGFIGFVFVPSADNPTGTLTLIIAPAQI